MEVAGGQARLKTFFTIRYDSATVILTVFSYFAMAIGGILGLSNNDLTLAVCCAIMLTILGCLTWPSRYGLTADRLQWHHGIAVNKSLEFRQIDRISPSEGRSGMTLSQVAGHRIEVGRKKFFISAVDHPGLLRAILDRSPHLRQYGHEWRKEVRE